MLNNNHTKSIYTGIKWGFFRSKEPDCLTVERHCKQTFPPTSPLVMQHKNITKFDTMLYIEGYLIDISL